MLFVFFILQTLVKAQYDIIKQSLAAFDNNQVAVEYSSHGGAFRTTFRTSSVSGPRDLPEKFDARVAYKECPSFSEIHDTGKCLAPLGKIFITTLNDRTCTRSDERLTINYSLEDLLSCCKACRTNKTLCTDTKNIFEVVKYWLGEGLASGGPHKSDKGCKPFSEKLYNTADVGECAKTCTNKAYNTPYEKDKARGEMLKVIISGDPNDIKTEVMNGPVIGYFDLTEDFFLHTTGVYKYEKGALLGVIPVKIVGWGKNGNDFFWWIYVPKVSARYNKTGYFQVERDRRLERMIFAPLVYKLSSEGTTKPASDPAPSIGASTILWIITIVVVLMNCNMWILFRSRFHLDCTIFCGTEIF